MEIASRKVRNLNPPARYSANIKANSIGKIKKYPSYLYHSLGTDVAQKEGFDPPCRICRLRASALSLGPQSGAAAEKAGLLHPPPAAQTRFSLAPLGIKSASNHQKRASTVGGSPFLVKVREKGAKLREVRPQSTKPWKSV